MTAKARNWRAEEEKGAAIDPKRVGDRFRMDTRTVTGKTLKGARNQSLLRQVLRRKPKRGKLGQTG